MTWAQRLKRVFNIDIATCSKCGGTVKVITCIENPSGIASALLRGDPSGTYPYIRQIVKDSGGTFVSVSQESIREARRMVEDLEGLTPCFSASATVAGLVKLTRNGDFPSGDTVLVNLSGRDRTPAKIGSDVISLVRSGAGWKRKENENNSKYRKFNWS
jgi:threonine synthase